MGNRPSTQSVAAIGIGNQTSSTHRSLATAGVHQFSIKGHSVIAGSDEPITSKPFRVGGYEWTIRYYPNGADAEATSRNKGFGFLPQMAFAPDLARTGAKRGH
jgi:hypothetical protein